MSYFQFHMSKNQSAELEKLLHESRKELLRAEHHKTQLEMEAASLRATLQQLHFTLDEDEELMDATCLRRLAVPGYYENTNKKRSGTWAFKSAAPCLWNNLPAHLKSGSVSVMTFKRNLKTHLFSQF
nr:hypothetical protein BaRGS_035189 [Batillaria attramentaria]